MKPRWRLLLCAYGSARSDQGSQNPDIPPTIRTKSLEHCVGESPYTYLMRDAPFRPGLVNALQQVQLFPGSEERQRMEGRACSLLDPQGRSCEQELVTIQAPRLLNGSFEIQIIENAHA